MGIPIEASPNGGKSGSGFLAHGYDRPWVQVGLETHQRVDREAETRDAHIPSFMRKVYHHLGGRTITTGITDDGSALTGFAQSADWGALCYDLLGAISNNIYGGWIEMG
ncbi:hypothetical protein J1N35_044155 [Gossypium stocksii]|uniref:Uncharacterized protein n=1 Tax=Gossypium stocksii TaxID=47602 RepID=A0A9D3U8Z2_9ROSI|nr:hypothetical protein J1N35_044155 [Gossypium stocksii]